MTNLDNLRKQADALRNNCLADEAIPLYQRLFRAYRNAGRHEDAGWALQMEGVCHKVNNNITVALECLWKACSYFDRHGIFTGNANTLRDIGIAYEYAGDLHNAERYLNDGLMLSQQCNDRSGAAVTLAKIGLVMLRYREFSRAERYIDQAISELKQTDHWFGLSTAYWHRAQLLVETGKYHPAMHEIGIARELILEEERENHKRRIAQYDGLMAHCLARTGYYSEAMSHLSCCLASLSNPRIHPAANAVVLGDAKATHTMAILSTTKQRTSHST